MNQPKRAKRVFTPEQKADIVRAIDAEIKGGLLVGKAVEKHDIAHSQYNKWKRQLSVGIRSSLRNGKSPVDKEKKVLEKRIEKLEKVILEQASMIADLKKETNWGS